MPAATPKSDAVRLRMLEMTYIESVSVQEDQSGRETRLMSRNMAIRAWWRAYLSVVLYAACDNWVDGEFSLFVQCRCRHCVCLVTLSDWSYKSRLVVAETGVRSRHGR